MARIYDKAFFNNDIVPIGDASLSIASSAVLYGLSVYTVFPVSVTADKTLLAFRLGDHYRRLINSARIIGIDTFETSWTEARFLDTVKKVVTANNVSENVFVRTTVHVNELVAGTRSRGLSTVLSMFLYEAKPIVPQDGARLKTSVWRRVPDYSIPSRAKVNGAYVNSVLAKQDAIDSGYDDCIFLDVAGHVCELSAANIFIVRDGVLLTPDTGVDLLEGINRKTVLEIAADMNIPVKERTIDLTELYIADEVFAAGTSAFIAPVKEVDARMVGNGRMGPITAKIREEWTRALTGSDKKYERLVTAVGHAD
ncbi:MAG: aminotransferase class IV [Spirochaetes bacterium]|nr:aminotransferase class IV [Spirochaetota bacterium]